MRAARACAHRSHDGCAKGAARSRAERIAGETQRARASQVESDAAQRAAVPLYLSAFAEELAKHLPKDAILFDEALTHSPELTRYRPRRARAAISDAGRHPWRGLAGSGRCQAGASGADGDRLQRRRRRDVHLSGAVDGGALPDRRQVRRLQQFQLSHSEAEHRRVLARSRPQSERVPRFSAAFDIRDPGLDFVSLARGMGVPGCRVAHPAEIAGAITAMLEHDGPFLIELILEDMSRGRRRIEPDTADLRGA